MDEKSYWLDKPGSVRKVLYALYAACGILIAFDLFYHRHAMLAFESWFGFYGVYGFVACVILVLVAKEMRKLLGRPEGYYKDELDDR